MPKARLDLRIDPELLAAVDAERAKTTRTAWIESALRQALNAPNLSDRSESAPVEPPQAGRSIRDLVVSTRDFDVPLHPKRPTQVQPQFKTPKGGK